MTGRLSVGSILSRIRPSEHGAADRNLASTSGIVLIVLISGACISFLAQLVTAKLIGAEDFGIYAYVLAWLGVLGYLSTLGFQESLLRFLPAYLFHRDHRMAMGALRFAIIGSVLTGAVFALIGFALLGAWDMRREEVRVALSLGLACVPLIGLRLVLASSIRAFGGIVSSTIPERLLRDGLALFLLTSAVMLNAPPTATTATLAMLGSAIGTLWISFRLLQRHAPPALRWNEHASEWQKLLTPILPLTAVTLASTAMVRAGVIVLGLLGETEAAGIFAVAMSVGVFIEMPQIAVANLFAPAVSRLHAAGDAVALQRLTSRAALLSLTVTVLMCAPILLVLPLVLGWFGPEFVAAEPAVFVIGLGLVIAAANGPQRHLITMTNREGVAAAMGLTFGFMNVLLAAILCPSYGPLGAAAAFSVSLVLLNLAMAIFIDRALNIRPGLLALMNPR